MTTALYEIETHEDANGTAHPAEHLWAPGQDGVAEPHGFLAHGGLHITGIGGPNTDESGYPAAFVALGHQQWPAVIEAAAAYMHRVHGWKNLHLYPGNDPAELIPRIPRAIHTHAVILCHPHPEHPCGASGTVPAA